MLSNHRTDALVALYAGYDVRTVPARRLINSRADRRDEDVAEVIVRNYSEDGRGGRHARAPKRGT